jgi:hypothetical protein
MSRMLNRMLMTKITRNQRHHRISQMSRMEEEEINIYSLMGKTVRSILNPR